MKETIGLISGLLVVVSIIPYAIGTYKRTIHPNLVSWSIWSILGLAILLTYKSSGAKANVWPALFGFTNPLLITIIAIWRGENKKPNLMEIICAVIGIITIVVWYFVRDDRSWSADALYLAIVADMFAAIPTIVFVWKTPMGDRPFAWLLFAIAYGLSMFAISERTFANYILPIYMTLGSSSIAIPLILQRIKMRVPAKEWI